MTIAEFRAAFPAFDAERFADARVSFWLTLAGKSLSAERWGDLLPEGTGLFVAHHLTLERAADLVTDGTGGLDAAAGPLLSKSKTVGGVSKSENRAGAAATGIVNAGHWNDTIYGKQYYQLALIVGAGGTVV